MDTPTPYPTPPRRGLPAWAWVLIILGALFFFSIACIAVLAAILFPVFAQAREKARQVSCQSNLKQIATVTSMYTEDSDGRGPLAENWQDVIEPRVGNPRVFECPTVQNREEGGSAASY